MVSANWQAVQDGGGGGGVQDVDLGLPFWPPLLPPPADPPPDGLAGRGRGR